MLAPVTDDRFERLQKQYGRALTLAALVEDGADQLPLPGAGETLRRWQALAAVAAHDLSLVKLFEGHTDAMAILAELGGDEPREGSLWATWCAEPPDARLAFEAQKPFSDTSPSLPSSPAPLLRLYGTKAWCSGAASVSHAVVSGWNAAGEPCLAAVSLHQSGVTVTDQGWEAVGMAGSASVDVCFDGAHATQLGLPGDYTRRTGFWHGGAGIAACWYGGALGIAQTVRERSRGSKEPYRLAHLGAIDVALAGAAAVLRESAEWIDTHRDADAQFVAMRARLAVERAAEEVIRHAGRALGAGPLCRDARFAQAMADLPVFLRQSHAERDLASLGTLALEPKAAPWTL
ncbi:MAG: acyl-CoA dehydrogenase [Variovorax sp.]|nr:acyl-CoA dehydrogenase [Variovorax sp.]